MENYQEKTSPFIIGGSIVLAGLIIAGAILYVSGALASGKNIVPQQDTTTPDQAQQLYRPVDETDHIRGSKDAEVVLIEYSDTECPFCISFHETLKQVMSTYGEQVAWVYRHVPLKNQSQQEVVALECAYDQGGDSAFWAYLDRLMSISPGNDQFDLSLLPTIATRIGLETNTFQGCLETKDVSSRVMRDTNDAFSAGLKGTPFTLVVGKKATFSVDGAQPFSVVSSFIEQALQ